MIGMMLNIALVNLSVVYFKIRLNKSQDMPNKILFRRSI